MSKGRIIIVGSVNMDLMLRCPHLPLAGETVLGGDFITAPGGKGANQAVAAARLGANVSFVGCVGSDAFGIAAKKALQIEGIDTQYLSIIPEKATGVAMVVSDEKGENCIALSPGANDALMPEHIYAAESLFIGASWLVCQLETPISTVQYAIEIAKRHGVSVLLNPAPASDSLNALLALGIDLLVPNAGEAMTLANQAVTSSDGMERVAQYLQRAGAKSVLVTLGSDGVLASTPQGNLHLPAPKVIAIDTTGAGDTFIGALVAGLSCDMPLVAAITAAQQAAAHSVTHSGAQASMPFLTELPNFYSMPLESLNTLEVSAC